MFTELYLRSHAREMVKNFRKVLIVALTSTYNVPRSTYHIPQVLLLLKGLDCAGHGLKDISLIPLSLQVH